MTTTISESVEQAVREYLRMMDEEPVTDLYQIVLAQVEMPLLSCVLDHTNRNQSRTAAILGLNRATLRKKLRKHRLL